MLYICVYVESANPNCEEKTPENHFKVKCLRYKVVYPILKCLNKDYNSNERKTEKNKLPNMNSMCMCMITINKFTAWCKLSRLRE